MLAPRSHQGCTTVDGQRRRRLLMGVPEVAPLLDFTSSSSYSSFSSVLSSGHDDVSCQGNLPIVEHKYSGWKPARTFGIMAAAASIFRSLFPSIQSFLIPTCRLAVPAVITPASAGPSRRKVTGTIFGTKRGRVCFAVQEDPRSDPVLLLDLAIPTSHLLKEMASGMVRILLECERDTDSPSDVIAEKKKKKKKQPQRPLWEEPLWTMYCNGQKRGYAVSRPCGEPEFRVLNAVQTVSVGAGVLPASFPLPLALPPTHRPMMERKESLKGDGCFVDGGGGSEVMYMRARFERVVGGKDSEAFYMINPDGGRGSNYNHGAPEISIFLLRM